MATSTPISQSPRSLDTDNKVTWEHLEDVSTPISQSSGLIDMENNITWEHLENAPSLSTPPSSNPITPNNEVTWEHLEDVSSCSSFYERDNEAVMDKRFSALYALHDPEPVSSLEVLQDMPLKALFLHVVAVFILWLVWLLFLIKMLGRELRLLEQKRVI